MMASERQIAANRRNARRSTGPATMAGKRRSSSNALRHGLSRPLVIGGSAELESLVCLLVGRDAEPHVAELARNAVRAHLNLVRIRELKSDMFARIYQFGSLEWEPRSRSSAEIRYVLSRLRDTRVRLPEPETIPSDEEERAAEAMRRLLPELRSIDRYEERAFNARQRSLRQLAEAMNDSSPLQIMERQV
jgi:hypothetical protein